MDAKTRGTVLTLCGVVLLVTTLSVGAVTAPDRTVTDDRYPTGDGGGATAGPTDGNDGNDGGDGDTDEPAVRRTLVGMQGAGDLWHSDGSVFLLEGVEKVWEEGSANSYFDVTMMDNGSVLAGFIHSGYKKCALYSTPCARTGFRLIDPEPEPTVVNEYSFPVRTIRNSEVHDVEALGDERFLITDMDAERIFIIKDGETVWSWNASSFYDAPRDPTRTDWLHINDVDVIDEDRYLVSVRNANQLVVVQRGEGVVEVINEDYKADDGRRKGDPDILNQQHNPQWLNDRAVLVADSENHRVVELHRTDNGNWEPTWILNKAGGKRLFWPRDADRLTNGNTLVTDTLNKRIFEVTPTGEVVWSIGTNRIPYEADRLPIGEKAGIAAYGGAGEGYGMAGLLVIGAANEEVPGLSPLLVGMRAIFPQMPFWFTESHLGGSLLSLLMMIGGLGYRAVTG